MKIFAAAGYLALLREFQLALMIKLKDLQVVTKFSRPESVTYVIWQDRCRDVRDRRRVRC